MASSKKTVFTLPNNSGTVAYRPNSSSTWQTFGDIQGDIGVTVADTEETLEISNGTNRTTITEPTATVTVPLLNKDFELISKMSGGRVVVTKSGSGTEFPLSTKPILDQTFLLKEDREATLRLDKLVFDKFFSDFTFSVPGSSGKRRMFPFIPETNVNADAPASMVPLTLPRSEQHAGTLPTEPVATAFNFTAEVLDSNVEGGRRSLVSGIVTGDHIARNEFIWYVDPDSPSKITFRFFSAMGTAVGSDPTDDDYIPAVTADQVLKEGDTVVVKLNTVNSRFERLIKSVANSGTSVLSPDPFQLRILDSRSKTQVSNPFDVSEMIFWSASMDAGSLDATHAAPGLATPTTLTFSCRADTDRPDGQRLYTRTFYNDTRDNL